MTMVLYGYKIRAALAGRVALRPPRLPQVRQHLFALIILCKPGFVRNLTLVFVPGFTVGHPNLSGYY